MKAPDWLRRLVTPRAGAIALKGLAGLACFAAFTLIGSHRAFAPASASPTASAQMPSAPAMLGASFAGSVVPDVEGSADGSGNGVDAGALPTAPAITADGRVVLNLASTDDLRRLPGVGASRARAILALRAKLGHFSRVEDLLRVKGIGRRSLARLRPLLVVDPP